MYDDSDDDYNDDSQDDSYDDSSDDQDDDKDDDHDDDSNDDHEDDHEEDDWLLLLNVAGILWEDHELILFFIGTRWGVRKGVLFLAQRTK